MSDHENIYSSDEDDSSIEDERKITQQLIMSQQLNGGFYPLKNTWILYDHTKSDSDTYEASTRKICEFNNVINFWQIFNNYPMPSKLFNDGINRPIMKCGNTRKEICQLMDVLCILYGYIKSQATTKRSSGRYSKKYRFYT